MRFRFFYVLVILLAHSPYSLAAPFDDLALRENSDSVGNLDLKTSVHRGLALSSKYSLPATIARTHRLAVLREPIMTWLEEHEIPVEKDGLHHKMESLFLTWRKVEQEFHQFLSELPWRGLSEFKDFQLESFLAENDFLEKPPVNDLIPGAARQLVAEIPMNHPETENIEGFQSKLETQLEAWALHAAEQGDEITLARVENLRLESKKLKKWLKRKSKKSRESFLTRMFYLPSEKASLTDTVQGILRAIGRILRSIFNPGARGESIQVHFNHPPESNQLDHFLLMALDTVLTHPRPRLWMHLYQLNHEPVVNKILDIAKRIGPEKVRLILEEHYIRDDFVPDGDGISFREAYLKLREAGIEIRTDRYQGSSGSGQSHNKFFVINDNRVWTGSYNITKRGTFKNTNHGINIQSKKLNQIYAGEFKTMWEGKFQKHKWNTTHHYEVMVDGTRIEVYFSPQDNVGHVIQKKLLEANHSIEVAMFFLSDTMLLNTLALQKDRGIAVNLLLDNLTLGVRLGQVAGKKRRLRDFLAEHEIPYKKDGGGSHLHHKFAILDARTDSDPMVISGSHNWTKSAREKNDENILVIHSREIALKFHDWWAQSYGEEIPVSDPLPDLVDFPKIEKLERDGNSLRIQMGSLGKMQPELFYGKKSCLSTEETTSTLVCILPDFFKRSRDGILDLQVTGLGTVDAFAFTNADERISRATYRLWRRLLNVKQWEECSPDNPLSESCMFPIHEFPQSNCLKRRGDLNRLIDWRSCSQF